MPNVSACSSVCGGCISGSEGGWKTAVVTKLIDVVLKSTFPKNLTNVITFLSKIPPTSQKCSSTNEDCYRGYFACLHLVTYTCISLRATVETISISYIMLYREWSGW